MNENQKLFIQCNMRQLLQQGHSPPEVLEKSLSILNNKQLVLEAKTHYDRCESLTKTIVHLGVIEVDDSLLTAISNKEKESTTANASFVELLAAHETISEVFSLLKIRLSMGLSYALWLSVIATIVFSIVNYQVLPQFEEIFQSFGADLPTFTKFALSWQSSVLSPSVLGFVFVITIGYLLATLYAVPVNKLATGQSWNAKLIGRIPFIKSVVNYTHAVIWMSHLRVLQSVGMDMKEALNSLSKPPKSVSLHLPDGLDNLQVAESIGTLSDEIAYQSERIISSAEKVVTQASRKIMAVILAFVAGFIIFSIFASYLPIFQLGAVV